MKYFRMSYEEVVFKRSYINVMLLNRSIPSFKTDNDDLNSGGKNKNRHKGNKAKEFHKVDKAMHANDFFMGLM